VLAVDRLNGAIGGYPEIVTRGFVTDDDGEALLHGAKKAVVESISAAAPEERADEGWLRARIVTDVKRYLRRRTQRHPLIIPVIVEL